MNFQIHSFPQKMCKIKISLGGCQILIHGDFLYRRGRRFLINKKSQLFNYDVPACPCLVENSWLSSLQPISEILSIGILKQLFFCNITIMRPDKSSKDNSIDMNSSTESKLTLHKTTVFLKIFNNDSCKFFQTSFLA